MEARRRPVSPRGGVVRQGGPRHLRSRREHARVPQPPQPRRSLLLRAHAVSRLGAAQPCVQQRHVLRPFPREPPETHDPSRSHRNGPQVHVPVRRRARGAGGPAHGRVPPRRRRAGLRLPRQPGQAAVPHLPAQGPPVCDEGGARTREDVVLDVQGHVAAAARLLLELPHLLPQLQVAPEDRLRPRGILYPGILPVGATVRGDPRGHGPPARERAALRDPQRTAR
mmetsp:Transcript_28017/g.54473  ORF Transcript_28017/g.54473 Transcript_28017/m.54473 type:complete len:225 (+) Transcript_28017:673-1347(+)